MKGTSSKILYGESWVDEGSNKNVIGYRFTSKELDTETGLYYFGARYLDPLTSRWISPDPAFEKYLPNTYDKNPRLPGHGGIYNSNNLNLYHYSNNNPIKYVDPDGNVAETAWDVLNAAIDAYSIASGINSRDWLGVAIDVGSLIYDSVATATPGLPGGTGAARVVNKLATEYGDDALEIALKYTDDVGQLVFKAGNSRRLGQNLIEAGMKRGQDQAAHHIVAGGSKYASAIEARNIFKKFDININEAVNGVFLDKSVHSKLHTHKYYDMVADRLKVAQTKEDAVQILKDIAQELSALNK